MADCMVVVQDIHPVASSAAERDGECFSVETRVDEWTIGGQHREHVPQRFLVDRGGMPDPDRRDVSTVGAQNALVNEFGDQR
jgi:hypothetical protein